MSETRHSAALSWIERNHPGGIALVARALSEAGAVECAQCGNSLAWHEDNRPRHTFAFAPAGEARS